MKVVAWARVSSREQREGYSIDAQLRAMRDRATKSGWTIVREFVVAESAKRGAGRTAFNQMFTWVKANVRREGLEAILSHKLDRICRNMRDAVRLQELEDACGVKLAFVDNQFGPGAAGALSFNVMAAVAQYYSDNLRAEVLKGMDEKVRQGWPTGHAPFGYMNVSNRDEPIVPHPEKSKTVARIFELYAAGGYTFGSLAEKLLKEGHTFRPSQPRFTPTGISYILNNRFYIGELHRNGQVYRGKYRLLIKRTCFDACQDILKGKNRRTGNPENMLSGGILRCACCGFAMTGEQIRRHLSGGRCNVHVYYKCSSIRCPHDHPRIRWREADIEKEILKDFQTLKIPSPRAAAWLRDQRATALDDASAVAAERRRLLSKRKTELANMLDRLMNGFLNGAIEEAAFAAKSADLKAQQQGVERQLDEAGWDDPQLAERALSLYDFSQNLVDIWHGSNWSRRREILECVSSNRLLSDTSLCLVKRKPFSDLAERLPFVYGRGDWI